MACVQDNAVCPVVATCVSTPCSGGYSFQRTWQNKFYFNCDGVCTLRSQYNFGCC